MPTYRIEVEARYRQVYLVDADDKDAAIDTWYAADGPLTDCYDEDFLELSDIIDVVEHEE